MRGKRRRLEEKIRILRQADGIRTILEVCDEHNIVGADLPPLEA